MFRLDPPIVDREARAVDVYFVVIECPNTGKATRTGVELPDISGFKFMGLSPVNSACEHCPEVHTWTQKDAWVERRDASRVHIRVAARPVDAAS
jgi:hypothetical protein